jgi:hypothetical protein
VAERASTWADVEEAVAELHVAVSAEVAAEQRKRGGQPGAANQFWRGGRSVASNGYVLIRVGKEHHLADVRGYAYEHRLVAETKLGRRLEIGEQVHHIDRNKQNNAPENLEIEVSIAHHRVEHRTKARVAPLRMPGEANPQIECACGCGMKLDRFDAQGRPRLFISGHNITRDQKTGRLSARRARP